MVGPPGSMAGRGASEDEVEGEEKGQGSYFYGMPSQALACAGRGWDPPRALVLLLAALVLPLYHHASARCTVARAFVRRRSSLVSILIPPAAQGRPPKEGLRTRRTMQC